MRIGITGASGFIGSAFGHHAASHGHEIVAFTRSGKLTKPWVTETRAFGDDADGNQRSLAVKRPIIHAADCEALVHLAGEPVFGYWSAAKKRRIWSSRVGTTAAVVEALGMASSRPRVLVCASGAGFYGDRGDDVLDERSERGRGFLSDVCVAWEAAAREAERLSMRAAFLRTGMVLGAGGGALNMLKKVFSLGLGGRLGSGSQWMPWIHLEDQVRLMLWAVENAAVAGPVNHVAPGAVTNAEFTAALAAALKRPAFSHAPAFALKLLLRDMASEMFLASQRVVPRVALDGGFTFQYPALESALASILNPAS